MTLTPRNLDHVVLPVPNLEIARERYSKLGFTVAPDGRHEFGSENCCVKFSNGTFIEPLAIGHRETVEANIIKGNNFLRRDAAYRFRNGDEGFWGLVFSSDDSEEDRKILKKAGYNTGKLVEVKRIGVHARLAFSIDERAPDFSIFLCQDIIDMPPADTKLTSHANGSDRIVRVTLHENVPSDFQYYLQDSMNQREVRSHSFGMDMEANNATITTLNADGIKAYYGADNMPESRGLRAFGFDVEVSDLSETQKLLGHNKIDTITIGDRLIVPPAPGQGATIAFVKGEK